MGWLKDCAICNEGLCKTIDLLKEDGLTERAACKRMSEESEKELGEEGKYSPNEIRTRYRYYAKGRGSKRPTKEKQSPISEADKIKVFSDEFRASFKNFYKQVEIEKNNNWEKTSKEAALFHLKKLGNLKRKR